MSGMGGYVLGDGGDSVWKGVLTAFRMLRSCGCCEPTMLKKGGCPVIINAHKELSNSILQ